MPIPCFKAYDIRGRLPDELNENLAWRIGRAYAEHFSAKTVVIGGDMRLSTPTLKTALSKGLRSAGVNVLDIGLCGTEEVYFATFHLKTDGGIMVTASHNPKDYNGMKLVQKHAAPISGDSGLRHIESRVENLIEKPNAELTGSYRQLNLLDDYIDHLLQYLQLDTIKPTKLVVNVGNGAAGHVIKALQQRFKTEHVPIELITLYPIPDGTFPHGVPNPLLPENRQVTSDAVIEHKADIGIAWDGDFDRCFFFDEKGQFIEGYYIVGLLAEAFLKQDQNASIIHDPRLIWNTVDIVSKYGGTPIMCKTGHAFIKERMRKENAVYGGEMSAHHYFRDFAYCDSGMIPWLLMLGLLSKRQQSLFSCIEERLNAFPTTGEINIKLHNPDYIIKKIVDHYASTFIHMDKTDGVSLSFKAWRFNLRQSNTEPLVRLNIETLGDKTLLEEKKDELLSLLSAVNQCGEHQS